MAKNEVEPKLLMGEKPENKLVKVEAMAALLDFFSDRAEAMASFMIACIFGMFGLLALAYEVSDLFLKTLTIIPYVAFCIICYHCYLRFSYFADMAQKSLMYIRKNYANYANIDLIYKGKRINLNLWQQNLLRTYGRPLERIIKNPLLRKVSMIVIFSLPSFVVYYPVLFWLFSIIQSVIS